jgi:glycosyltransferase involved in cell wall biosynthesis
LRLVLAGHLIEGRTPLRHDLEALGLDREVLLTGLVPDAELILLYAGASLFVYPSWWEGFGLPPLEAMAMGIPVITYRAASLPEVVGDAAILIEPPFESDALADAMARVLHEDAFRAELIARGRMRASAFSWERVVDQTMAVYGRCLGLTAEDRPSA